MAGGRRRERTTGHYLPAASRSVDQGYFTGDNYVDHEPESAGDHPRILALLRRHRARGPVLEDFADPFRASERLTAAVAPGAVLVLTSTNADSLSHWLFGPEWEGYFDWTHLGVDQVGVRSLRAELPRL